MFCVASVVTNGLHGKGENVYRKELLILTFINRNLIYVFRIIFSFSDKFIFVCVMLSIF